MNTAFIYLESIYYDDSEFSVRVYEDDLQVLLFEVEDGNFDLCSYVNLPKLRQGYYFLEYTTREEVESWEMPHIHYPVVKDIKLKYCWWGLFYLWYLHSCSISKSEHKV